MSNLLEQLHKLQEFSVDDQEFIMQEVDKNE